MENYASQKNALLGEEAKLKSAIILLESALSPQGVAMALSLRLSLSLVQERLKDLEASKMEWDEHRARAAFED